MLKAGIQVDNYYAYEIDKYAIQTATHNFPQIQELGDVFNADFTKYSDIDYLIGGSPCFTKGHLVLTADGYKDVSEIQVGDMVLTHRGRYRKVIRTNKREADIVDVKIMGYPAFHTTAEHPFYTLERRKATWDEYNKTKSWRVFSTEPKWTKAIELKPKTHFCGQLIGKSAEINAADIDEELAYILGRYVADGYIRKSKRQGRQNSYQYQVMLSIGASKIKQFKKNVTQRHFSCYEHTESVYRACFSSMELLNFIEQNGFGKGASNKAIPEFIYNLPREIQLAFLSGYMDGDGHIGEYQYCASTVSPKLAFGLQRLVTQIYGVNAGVTVCSNDRPHKIGDREIHSNYPLYTVVWKESIKKQSVAHIQDGIVWTQVKNVCKTLHSDIVYNIEVDEDNSYTVNNVIVHNCTFWSIAQSPDKRETTASGLGWDLFSQYVRALHEAEPKFFIYENNRSMSAAIRQSITETFGFEAICINSALVSAQNRQRLYWVGKRNADGTYSKVDVEQPEDRGILLRDILDGACTWNTIERHQRSMVAEPVGTTQNGKSYCLSAGYSNGSGENIGNYAAHTLQKGCKSMVAEPVNVTAEGKAQCLRATCYKDGIRNIAGNIIDRKTGVAEPVACRCRGRTTKGGKGYAKYECREDNKSNTLDTNTTNGNMVAEPICIASRGRYSDTDSRSSKTDAPKYQQHYEARTDSKTNAVTTVSKDNLIGEPVRCFTLPREDGVQTQSKQYRVYETSGKSTTLCAEGGGMGAKTGLYAIPIEFDGDIPIKAVSGVDGKTYTVYEVKDGNITIKGKTYPIKLVDGYYIIRKLTVSECKRLQTVPEWYRFPVSDTQAYKMLGNGWTCDVITHLIKATLK